MLAPPLFISFIAPLITQVIREMGSGMKALDTKAFIPLPISLIICFMRGRMKDMKCGVKSVEGPALPMPAQAPPKMLGVKGVRNPSTAYTSNISSVLSAKSGTQLANGLRSP